MKKRRNPNRGVVLALHDAAAIHRMLEYFYDDRRWFNPIEAAEAQAAGREGMHRLGEKLMDIFAAHREQELDDTTGMTADERAWLG